MATLKKTSDKQIAAKAKKFHKHPKHALHDWEWDSLNWLYDTLSPKACDAITEALSETRRVAYECGYDDGFKDADGINTDDGT